MPASLEDFKDKSKYKIFTKKVLPPKTVHVLRKNDKGQPETVQVELTPGRIDKWIENHKKLIDAGRLVPAPFRHDLKANPNSATELFFREGPPDKKDTNAFDNGGYWLTLDKDKDGVLEAQIAVPVGSETEKKIGTTIREVSPLIQRDWVDGDGVKYDDVITHIALVTHPNIGNQSNFVPTDNAVALSFDSSSEDADAWAFVALSQDGISSSNDPGSDKMPHTQPASSSDSVSTAIRILSELGLTLPADTSPENLSERIVVAGQALINLKKSLDNTKAPGGSKEQPLILLSLDNGCSLSLPEKDGVDWSNYKAGFNAMAQTTRQNYIARVKKAVNEGRIPASYANENLIPLTDNLQLSLDDSNTCIEPNVEKMIGLLEKLPRGTALTGLSVANFRQLKTNVNPELLAMGLSQGFEHVNDEEDSENDGPVQSVEEADKVVDQLLKNTGRMKGKKSKSE